MSDAEDSFHFDDYHIQFYEEMKGPPLIKTKSRLIAAVVQNQLQIVKNLLAPKWYNIKDKHTHSLLQIAILCNKKEIFDYLLSLPNFPVDYKNKASETALETAFGGFGTRGLWVKEHYALEFLKKGTYHNIILTRGFQLLHRALRMYYNNVAKFLIENGASLNPVLRYEQTHLRYAIKYYRDYEIIATLLCYGSNSTIDDFFEAFLDHSPIAIQEHLFYNLFEDETEITLELIVRMAESESIFFYELLQFPPGPCDYYIGLTTLCQIKKDYLIAILEIEMFFDEIEFSLTKLKESGWPLAPFKNIKLENLFIILETDLKFLIIDIIEKIGLTSFHKFDDEEELTSICCYLMSYGANVREIDLQYVYQRFGYCTLFKILLHMEFVVDKPYEVNNMSALFYNMSLNIDILVNEICDTFFLNKNNVPLLVQLARDAFRAYFIKTFSITKSWQFLTHLKKLPISNVYKKIISYETALYEK